MSKSQQPVWMELVQLVPAVSFALPFIVRGDVDLARAGSGFLLGAVLFAGVSWLVVQRGGVLNPILVGTGVWLVLGALAFNLPIDALASVLATARGFSLFVVIGAVGLVSTFASPQGFVGSRSPRTERVRRASFVLLLLAGVSAAWAHHFRADIRLGGGLPFIVLNVARRVLIRRSA